MTSVCILDYGSGNVRSVFNLFEAVCGDVVVSNDARRIEEATHLVLPGVGAFGAAMRKIRETLPLDLVRENVFHRQKPFLGICVGMQVLAERGLEFGEFEGLGWIPGVVDRLESGDAPLPHIGWNSVRGTQPSPLLVGLEVGADFYFLHSFVFRPASESTVAATAAYGEEFACIVQRDRLFGVQFHPEKSQKAGRRLVENFLAVAAGE